VALANDGSISEQAGTGSMGNRGSFQRLLREGTLVAPLLLKPCQANPLHKHILWSGSLEKLWKRITERLNCSSREIFNLRNVK